MAKKHFKILGVRIDNLSKLEILKTIEKFLKEPRFHQVATINPEFILEAQKNKKVKNILNNCDLNIADGFGIKLAFWRFGKNLECRFPGTDLMTEILKIAHQNNYSIFLATNKNGLSYWRKTRDAILKNYPNLRIKGANLNKKNTNYKLQITNYDILFCNFGAPHQEKFINSLKNGNIKLAMGVGGSFDFLTKKIQRAPEFVQFLGLEWFWRLILQPKRFKRIFNAIVVFLWKVMLS